MLTTGLCTILAMLSAYCLQSPKRVAAIRINKGQGKQPAFPQDKARWTIRGSVKAEYRLNRMYPQKRVLHMRSGPAKAPKWVKTGKQTFRSNFGAHYANTVEVHVKARVQQNSDLSLPNVVITIQDLEKRWSSFPSRTEPVKLVVDAQRGFDQRAVTAYIGNRIALTILSDQALSIKPPGGKTWMLEGGEFLGSRTRTLVSKQSPEGGVLVFQMGPQSLPLPAGRAGDILAFTYDSAQNDFAFLYMGAHHVQAVTDKKGRFQLPRLPDGEYELLAIHELLGRTTARVKIKAADPEPIQISFKVPAILRSDGFPSPLARWAHAMAYDPIRRRTVLYGGWTERKGKSSCLGDLWEWDGLRWWEINADTGPSSSARAGHAMAFDEQQARLVVFGGREAGRSALWEWGESREKKWLRIETKGVLPASRWNTAIAYDQDREQLVLFGGRSKSRHLLSDTWKWQAGQWTQLKPKHSPSPREGHTIVYDSTRGRMVLFGGLGQKSESAELMQDTWEWDGTDWSQIETSDMPAARRSHAMAYDSLRQRTVLHGGFQRGESLDDRALSDTWEWDGKKWEKVLPASPSNPPGRWNAAMVYDSARKLIVLFGGHAGPWTLGDTWEWNGQEWKQRK